MVKVAIVGLGFMGRMHAGIYGQFEDVEITALCDDLEENLEFSSASEGGNIAVGEMQADLSKAARYTDFSRMLEEGGFDFVDLCVPTFLHKPYSVEAMKSGYDVFCEKPMALNAEEAEEMISVSRETGRLLTIGQCLRFWPMYVKIKEIIDSKQYGNVVSAELTRYSSTPGWSSRGWILDGTLSGNAALDMHIHDVDMILHYFGMPKSVTSSGTPAEGGGFGHIATIYDYPGMTVTSAGNWICSSSFGLVMRALIVLEKAVVELDSTKDPMLAVFPDGGERIVPELDPKDGYYNELRAFTDNVKNRTEPAVSAESAGESLYVALKEIESAEKNTPVSL